MHWISFILCAGLILTLQSTAAERAEIAGARPDWLLVLVVFFALHARRRDAILAAWIIGACADLLTIERPGLLSLSYLTVAMAVASVRDFLFRQHLLTQALVTAVACLLIRVVWLTYRRLLYDPVRSLPVDLAADVLLASIYTALWAPVFHWLLMRMSRSLGISRPRYRYPGLRRTDGSLV